MKLYVGNLPFDMGDEDVRKLFSAFGRVEAADVICHRDTGRSRGFAFVTMASDEDGTNAIAGLHGYSADGRVLDVSEARPNLRPAPARATRRPDTGAASTYYGGRSW